MGQVLDETPLERALRVGVPVRVIIFVPFCMTGFPIVAIALALLSFDTLKETPEATPVKTRF